MEKPKGAVRTVALTDKVALVCGPSEQRVALLFSPHPNGFYTVSTDPNVALGAGINVIPDGGPVELTADACGDAVVRQWYGITNSDTPMTVGYIEVVAI